MNRAAGEPNAIGALNRNTLIYVPAIAIPALLNLVSLTLYTRLLPTEEYGLLNLAISASVLLIAVFAQWIGQAVQRYRPEYRASGHTAGFNLHLLSLLLPVYAVLLAAALALFPVHWRILGGDWKLYALTVGLTASQGIYLIGSLVLQSDGAAARFRAYNILQAVLKLAFALILFYLLHRHYTAILLGTIAAYCLLTARMATKVVRAVALPDLFRNLRQAEFKRFARRMLAFGVPLAGWLLCTAVLDTGDRFMISLLLGNREVGIYTGHYVLITAAFSLLCTPLLTAAHPILMNLLSDRSARPAPIADTLGQFTRIFTLLYSPAAAMLVLGYPHLAPLLLGDAYREGTAGIWLLVIGVYVWNLCLIGHKSLEMSEKTRLMLIAVACAACVNLALNLWLIPAHGYAGAYAATAAGFFAYAVFVHRFAARGKIPWTIPWRSVFRIPLICLILFLVFHFVNKLELPINTYLLLTLECLLFIAGYIGALAAWNELRLPARFRIDGR